MIKTKVNRETNYIYHMLSVARCGYDNEYGQKWRGIHSQKDLQSLKRHELLITVKGGAHCGALYWPLVAIPACLDTLAADYYAAVRRFIKYGDSDIFMLTERFGDCIEQCKLLSAEVFEICAVMERNYNIYTSKVWEHSHAELHEYAEHIQQIFDSDKSAVKIDALIGQKLDCGFIATFCNSLDYGPEAIDISADQDVFGLGKTCGRTYEIAESFILHEYAIYLLKQALQDTEAFSGKHDNWAFTEAMAEFYLSKAAVKAVMDGGGRRENIEIYNKEYALNPGISPAELFNKAISTGNK